MILRSRKRHLRLAVLFVGVSLVSCGVSGCATAIRYADELTSPDGERSAFVSIPATTGGFVGLVVGVAANIGLLGITGPVYLVRKQQPGPPPDVLSTLFFPTFVLWQGGKLIGAPFDAIEFVAYRAWLPRESMSRGRREEIERRYDQQLLPSYLVRPIFPSSSWSRDEADELLEPASFDRSFLLRTLSPDNGDATLGR